MARVVWSYITTRRKVRRGPTQRLCTSSFFFKRENSRLIFTPREEQLLLGCVCTLIDDYYMSITSHQQYEQQLLAMGHQHILIDFFSSSMHNFFVLKDEFKFKYFKIIDYAGLSRLEFFFSFNDEIYISRHMGRR